MECSSSAPLQWLSCCCSNNEKTTTVHSIMVSVKVHTHLGIFKRREMDVGKQKVSEALTGGTMYRVCLRWGRWAQEAQVSGKIYFMAALIHFSKSSPLNLVASVYNISSLQHEERQYGPMFYADRAKDDSIWVVLPPGNKGAYEWLTSFRFNILVSLSALSLCFCTWAYVFLFLV